MLETGRIGIARVALRARQSLAALRVFEGRVLTMETMFWPDEVRSWTALEGVTTEPSFHENEVRMAVEGREVYEYREPETARVLDLMEALRASVDLAREERAREEAPATAQARGLVPGDPPPGRSAPAPRPPADPAGAGAPGRADDLPPGGAG